MVRNNAPEGSGINKLNLGCFDTEGAHMPLHFAFDSQVNSIPATVLVDSDSVEFFSFLRPLLS